MDADTPVLSDDELVQLSPGLILLVGKRPKRDSRLCRMEDSFR
jgi:hypothetical protein